MQGAKQKNKNATGNKTTPVKKSSSPKVSNLIKQDPNNPLPLLRGQSFSTVNNNFYTPFLTNSDNYAQQLLEARLLSATNNACITTKKNYCAGDGFIDINGKELTSNIIEWLDDLNMDGDHVTAINEMIFEDFFTYGNVPIEMCRFSLAGKKYFFIYVHDFLEWRLGKPDQDDRITYAVQSKLFLRELNTFITADQLASATRLNLYSPFNMDSVNWTKDSKGVERALIWYKNRVTGFPYYGLPSNIASLIFQSLEYKGGRYNMDEFDNNMVVAAILALKGNLSQTEADRIGRKVINQHTGDGKRGRTVVVASEEGIESSSFHKMDTRKDGSYTEADALWSQKIILANEWDAILSGIISPSTLGKGSGFLTKIKEEKRNAVIRPAQRRLMEKVWKYILKEADAWLNLGLADYKLQIKDGIDISGLTDVDITPAVQVNEVREAKGLQKDPAMNGVYMKPAAPDPNAPKQEGGNDV